MKRAFFVLFFTMIFLIVGTIKLIPTPDVRQLSGLLGKKGIPLDELNNETEFKQSFLPRKKSINAIAINFGTFQRKNKGMVALTLSTLDKLALSRDDLLVADRKLAEVRVSASELKQRDYIFRFPPVKTEAGQPLLVTLSSSSPLGRAVTAWASKKDIYKDGLLTVNDKQINGDLVFQTYHNDSIANILKHAFRGETRSKLLIHPILLSVSMLLFLVLCGFLLWEITFTQLNEKHRDN